MSNSSVWRLKTTLLFLGQRDSRPFSLIPTWMASVAAQEGPGNDPPIQLIEGPGKITPRQASSQHGAELPIKKAHLPVYLLIAFTLFDVVACFYLIHFTNFVFLQHFTNFVKICDSNC